MTTTADTAPTTSEAIRAASWNAHQAAEGAPFMGELMAGKLDRSRYAELVAQHHFAYVVLEEAAEAMADDPVAKPFVFPELTRVPSLEADLAFLLGDDWRDQITANPGTQAYCARMREVCFDWPAGFVAHHYVRYLGDLSGGQFIGKVVERTYDLPDHAGARFYVFDQIDDPKAFKERYRQLLDAAPWDADEQARMTDEVLRAYELNTQVLVDLG